jgi:hypothetical protein
MTTRPNTTPDPEPTPKHRADVAVDSCSGTPRTAPGACEACNEYPEKYAEHRAAANA